MTIFQVDCKKFINQINKLINGLEDVASEGLEHIALLGAKEAREHHEYHSYGGNGLEANTVPYKNSALNQGIIANKYYASWVEYGNGPEGSRIYPVSAKFLHFWIDGKEIFAKSVAASKPKPFMANAVKFVEENGERIMSQHLNNFIKGL